MDIKVSVIFWLSYSGQVKLLLQPACLLLLQHHGGSWEEACPVVMVLWYVVHNNGLCSHAYLPDDRLDLRWQNAELQLLCNPK